MTAPKILRIKTPAIPTPFRGGDLVEVWFYWEDGVAEAFREGARLGSTVFLGGR